MKNQQEMIPAEVSRSEFDMLQQQLAEMQTALQSSQEQTAAMEQAMNNLIDGLQSEKDIIGKEDFYNEFSYEFGGNHEYSDNAWQMYEDSDKSLHRRDFVSHLVSQMDNEMRDYLAAKGMEVVFKSGESEPSELVSEKVSPGVPEEEEIPPQESYEEEIPPTEPSGTSASSEELSGEEKTEKVLSAREKINRLLTQNE